MNRFGRAFGPLLFVIWTANAQRLTVPLDGIWQIDESLTPDTMPAAWRHEVQVPGLVNLARPGFAQVDEFDSKEIIRNRVRKGKLPEFTVIPEGAGISRQPRNYFWYKRRFRLEAARQVALLRINKAQFGTAAWVNGVKVGDYPGCFSASYFDMTRAVKWGAENEVIIRIGAHPAVLPKSYPTGTDNEKNRWTPGIYDSVSVLTMDNPVIETIQVAPKIDPAQIVVQTKLRNYDSRPATVTLRHRVRTWKGSALAAAGKPRRLTLQPGEEQTFVETIPIANATLWSPENPFLYVLESSTGGDSVSTRFGVREFQFDTPSKRAMLNGKPYFLRGSNITLHRFFEDPEAGNLAWDETWVRKLLAEIPKRMNWNAFRFCIGPVPDRWLEIADEAGLLIQNEFFIWTGLPGPHVRTWDTNELIRQYKDWMRDNWNHPSLVVWDANNESLDPVFREKIIPAVRPLDLSSRPWENSYNLPAGPNDPVEDHPYLFIRTWSSDTEIFKMMDLEGMSGSGRNLRTPSAHAMILNEYGWLWLNRDGSPTELTPKVYEYLLGRNANPKARLKLSAYLLAGLTEFWRAHRNHAGVLHFVYLTSCYPGAYTCDNFEDIKSLRLEPHFADYVREAFKPLGVYVNFWRPSLKAGEQREFTVMMVNDLAKQVAGTLALSLETASGEVAARVEQPFAMEPLGAETYLLKLSVPPRPGEFLLKATANPGADPTVSRRKVTITPQ